MVRSEIEPIAKNRSCDQVIYGARHTHSKSKIDLPLRCKIQVNSGENLVLRIGEGIEPGEGADEAIVFGPTGNFRREVVAELKIRQEDNTLADTWAVERPV